MKCLSCDNFSLKIICEKCQNLYLKPKLIKKEIITGFDNYSFYDYEDIKDLLYSKYDAIGSQIFTILANNSFKKFSSSFTYPSKTYALNIDDDISKGYSHSAILTNSLKSKYIKPLFNTLTTRNKVKFANKSYQFRLLNPRNYKYNKPFLHKIKDIILVDDIVTSALSMLEAKDVLIRENINTLFCITLCNLQK